MGPAPCPPARAPYSALAAEPPLRPDEWSRLLPGRDPAASGAPAPPGESSGQSGAGPGATSELGSLCPRRWAPLRELGVLQGSGRRDSCARQGLEVAAAQGSPTAQGLPGRGHPVGVGARPAAAGVGGPRLLSGIFRRGARRRFLCPSFRFPLARPPHSWSHREWGRGSGAGHHRLALRVGLRCGLRGSGPGPQPCPALSSALWGCGWVRERGARGITQRWAALLGFFHLPAAEAGEGPLPSQQGQSPALESGFNSVTPQLTVGRAS